MTETGPQFPPLLRGMHSGRRDPFDLAIAQARAGADPGLVVHGVDDLHLRAAVVLAPEIPLGAAMIMVPAVAHGLCDALGALAPPEVAVQLGWPGTVLVNGAVCGGLRAAASTRDPDAEPDWLVIGMEMRLALADASDPGRNPDITALHEEGCGDIAPGHLLESWSRHMLVWINTWEDSGPARLLSDWTGRAFDFGKQTRLDLPGGARRGVPLGLDDAGGLVFKTSAGTETLPLTLMLEDVPC